MTSDGLEGFRSRTIVVAGDVMLDAYVMGEVRRLSPEAPVPIVRVKGQSASPGGAGNVALNVAGLGCRTVLLGVRGDDPAGQRLSAILRGRGIGDRLIVDGGRSTTTKTRIIGQGQQLLRLDEEDTLEGSDRIRERLLTLLEESLGAADAVILSDYDKGVLNGSICTEIIGRCTAKGIPAFVDPKGKDWERYDGATCVTPNTSEVQIVTGKSLEGGNETSLVECARDLRERYHVEWLLVTRGPQGMCLVGPGDAPFFITSAAREVFDVSGAGDTVIATLAAGVASGLTIPRAAEIANIAAGIVVGKLGSQAIDRKELDAALRMNLSGSLAANGSKITTVEAAQVQVKAWQAAGQNVIYANGSFDLLHPGHIRVLQTARALGDRLVVGLAGDAAARSRGGSRATLPEQHRAYVLSALSCVDLIVPFQEETPLSSIRVLRPDVVVRTAGTNGGAADGHEIVESYGGRVCVVPLLVGYEEI